MSEQALALCAGAGVCLFIVALKIHQNLESAPMPDPEPVPEPTPSLSDQVDDALASLRKSQASLSATIATQAGTALGLTQAQKADGDARAALTAAAADRDQKRASLEALIDHLFSTTPPFA